MDIASKKLARLHTKELNIAKKRNLSRETESLLKAAQTTPQGPILLKRKLIVHNRITSGGYVAKERKRLLKQNKNN